MQKRFIKFVDSLRTKGIANFGAVEGNANSALVDGPMVSDILKFKTGDGLPLAFIKNITRGHGTSLCMGAIRA